jgi:hypothetical protein
MINLKKYKNSVYYEKTHSLEKGDKMKKAVSKMLLAMGICAGTAGMASAEVDCSRFFMTDECKTDGYSVVESEKNVRGPHNWMCCIHYFPGEEPLDSKCLKHTRGKVARVH